MQAEIKRINDESQKQKAELLAQEKLADQMVMEFTKKKMVGTWFLMSGTSGQEWNVLLREAGWELKELQCKAALSSF